MEPPTPWRTPLPLDQPSRGAIFHAQSGSHSNVNASWGKSLSARPPVFARIADIGLFLAGILMIAAAVFLVDEAAGQSILILLGAGLMVIGALLPRLSGTIKISPGSVEMTVVQQLEATRREAEQRIPSRTEEAVGLAFKKLAESGQLAQMLAETHPPPTTEARPRKAALRRLAPAAAAVALLLIAATFLVQPFAADPASPPLDGGAPPTPGVAPSIPSPNPELESESPSIATFIALTSAVAVLATGGIIFAMRARRHRAQVEAESRSGEESPEVFGRRIVDELTDAP